MARKPAWIRDLERLPKTVAIDDLTFQALPQSVKDEVSGGEGQEAELMVASAVPMAYIKALGGHLNDQAIQVLEQTVPVIMVVLGVSSAAELIGLPLRQGDPDESLSALVAKVCAAAEVGGRPKEPR